MRTRKTYTLADAAAPLAGLGALALLLAGCATNSASDAVTPGSVPIPAASRAVSGSVYGGQQPVSGATIQLYAVATTSKGSASPLISATVTTASNGTFTITGDYSCTGNPLVYIVATGGNPGGGTNSALSMMAALGPCNNLSSTTFISINELTTVASVYALAPFMSGYKNVGAASTNAAGIANAFQTVNSLVNTAIGTAPGPGLPTSGTVPTTVLNTLANILASCVNSSGPGTGTPCTNLFTAATPSGGTAPSDTVGAALNVATHPGSNVSTLFGLAAAQPPFGPTLTSSPNDWTVAIKYTDPSIKSPYGLAIDASGSIWVTNETGASVTKLSGIGTILSGATGFTGGGLLGPKGIAIDRSGNAWIANTGGSSIVKLGPSGTLLSGASGFTGGGIDAPVAIAVDSQANVYARQLQWQLGHSPHQHGIALRRESAHGFQRHRQPQWNCRGQRAATFGSAIAAPTISSSSSHRPAAFTTRNTLTMPSRARPESRSIPAATNGLLPPASTQSASSAVLPEPIPLARFSRRPQHAHGRRNRWLEQRLDHQWRRFRQPLRTQFHGDFALTGHRSRLSQYSSEYRSRSLRMPLDR